jgi:hypothetical protein
MKQYLNYKNSLFRISVLEENPFQIQMEKKMKRFRKVYVPHVNFRFSPSSLLDIADEIVYVCDTPMFDDMADERFVEKFEGKVVEHLNEFSSELDAIAFYGDAVIFAMMAAYLSDKHDSFFVARFSTKRNEYVIRRIGFDMFDRLLEKGE